MGLWQAAGAKNMSGPITTVAGVVRNFSDFFVFALLS